MFIASESNHPFFSSWYCIWITLWIIFVRSFMHRCLVVGRLFFQSINHQTYQLHPFIYSCFILSRIFFFLLFLIPSISFVFLLAHFSRLNLNALYWFTNLHSSYYQFFAFHFLSLFLSLKSMWAIWTFYVLIFETFTAIFFFFVHSFTHVYDLLMPRTI